MDYYQGIRYLRITVLASFLALCICEPTDRDIILTPKQSSQVKGKSLYYRSVEDLNNAPGVRVPWERVLKHLTYITLYGMPNEQNKLDNDNVDYKRFMNASYDVQTNQIVTNFGDIITLAEGRVEKRNENEYRFIEGKCTKDEKSKCNNKHVMAQWQVQKIRHRDGEKKFRYEIKFSINPYEPEENGDKAEGRDSGSGKRVTRAFILRDTDYPDSFLWFDEHVSQRRIDENRRYLERLHRFNEVFSQPVYIDSTYYTSDNPIIPQLNIGEFLQDPIHRRAPVYSQYIPPTTYRPKYHVKFSKPSLSYEVPIERGELPIKSPVIRYNQPYYFNDNKYEEVPKQYNQQNSIQFNVDPSRQPPFEYVIQTPPPIKHQIPLPPNIGNHLTQTPVPIQLTSPLIQPPSLLYSQYSVSDQQYLTNLARNTFQSGQNFHVPQYQQVPQVTPSVQPLIYNFPSTATPIQQTQEYLQEVTPTRPFIESPKQENIRYSEPDPLYKNAVPEEQQLPVSVEQTTRWRNADIFEEQQKNQQEQPIQQNVRIEPIQQNVRFEPIQQNVRLEPIQQNVRLEEQLVQPTHDDLNTESNEGIKTSSYSYSSGLETDRNAGNPSEVDQNTEQNQITEDALNSNNDLQVPAPQPDNEQPSTIEPPHTSSPNEVTEHLDNQPQSPDISAKIPQPVSSVEVTHLGEPKDPPIIHIHRSNHKTEKTSTSTTTQRSVNSQEGVLTSLYPKANLLNDNDFYQVTKAEAHFKSSTERPVLKWKPKRPRTKNQNTSNTGSDTTIIIAKTRRITQPSVKAYGNDSDVTIERIPDEDTVQKIFKIKPTTESGRALNTNETNISTKRSYSTSISIKVGTDKEVPYPPTVSVPNVELFKAKLERLNTNSTLIKFFKASDKNDKPGEGDEVDKVITRSIVKHATSLDI